MAKSKKEEAFWVLRNAFSDGVDTNGFMTVPDLLKYIRDTNGSSISWRKSQLDFDRKSLTKALDSLASMGKVEVVGSREGSRGFCPLVGDYK